ncbi:MAG: hypothetical protein U0790_19125 [Isosphaeraceae bacterium]
MGPRGCWEDNSLRLLGHGPRGRSFPARPLSLGPPRVVKQVAPDRAADLIFLAHHTREAFAAAEIRHANLTGLDLVGRGARVPLQRRSVHPRRRWTTSLDRAPMEPYQATVLILQAARALRARPGLWHKDVKPRNPRGLAPDGLLKLDDLGLEMTPSLASAIEAAERPEPPRGQEPPPSPPAVVGTPAYMAPEQSRDAARIDGRADIYALGATYYQLVTGHPPFEDDNAAELIRRHQEEPPVPAEQRVPGLPRAISDAIRTMMGKHPDERYPNMAVVVDVLEGILQLRGEGAQAFLAETEPALTAAGEVLRASPLRLVRSRILGLCVAIGLACGGLMLALGLFWPALGILVFLGMVGALVALSSGVLHGSELIPLVGELFLGDVRSWLILLAVAIATAAALWSRGGFLPWFLLLNAAGLAAAYHAFLDRPWARVRAREIAELRDRVTRLRARGFGDEEIDALVFRAAGAAAPEIREALFGRSASKGATDAVPRPGWLSAMVERVKRWVEDALQERHDRRHQAILEAAETGRLEAGGVNLLTARRRARRIAKAMLAATREWRDEQRLLAPSAPGAAGPPLAERLARAARQPEPVLEPHEPQRGALLRRLDALAATLLGRTARFLLATLLLGLFAYWLDQKGIVTFDQVRSELASVFEVVRRAARRTDLAELKELRWTLNPPWARLREPLDLPWLSAPLGPGLPGANLGVAGVLLLISLISGRVLPGLMSVLGAAVALFGPRWGLVLTPLLSRLDAPAQAGIAGALLLVLGLLLPRFRRPAS